jgi:TrmH family RNA methyltransferase
VRLGPGVIERVSDTVTPQRILAVCGSVDARLDALKGTDLVVVCVDVRDPGNLGTVVRSAGAAGAGGVICCSGTVDVYNPKCLRASAGAVFHLRLVDGGQPVEVLEALRSWGMNRLAATAAGGAPYDGCDLTGPTALVLGNEGHGISQTVLDYVDGAVTIPLAASAESLNVAMAATVLCFEAARQRRS